MSLFITVEGGEGGGKSTNMTYIADYLKAKGYEVVETREPGGTALGEKLRNLLLDKNISNMDCSTELLLMFAARAQHIAEVIKPALDEGKWVLCDRFTDATYAYQGGGRNIPMERIAVLENWVQGELRPDLTILLDIPVEEGMKRATLRGEKDRFEQEQISFFERVRQSYLTMATRQSDRYRVVNAAQPLECVQSDIKQVLEAVSR